MQNVSRFFYMTEGMVPFCHVYHDHSKRENKRLSLLLDAGIGRLERTLIHTLVQAIGVKAHPCA